MSKSRKRHWSFIVTDYRYIYPAIFILSVIGVVGSVVFNDPTIFSRMGNFIIGFGVWMSMRFTLREGLNRNKNALDASPTLPGPGPAFQVNSNYFNNIAFSIGDAVLQLRGFKVVVYGSVVGSWGDRLLEGCQRWLSS